MAVNYTNLFEDVGRILKAIDQFRDAATGSNSPRPNMPTLLSEIEAMFVSNSRTDVMEGVNAMFRGFRDSLSSWGGSLSQKITERFSHRETILNELLSAQFSGDIQHILQEMSRDMTINSQTIKRSSVTIGGVSALSGNNGNGTVVITKVLDGYNQPSPGFAASPRYRAVDSELAVPDEIMSLTCVQDEDADDRDEGQELFLLEGEPAFNQQFDWNTEGSGVSLSVPTLNSYDLLANRDFEIFETTNQPNSWTVEAGTLGANILQETTTANLHRGFSALKLVGDSEDIDLRQHLGIRTITPNRMFLLSAAIRGSATIDGTLTIKMVSDSGGYTAGGTELISKTGTQLQAMLSYSVEHCWILTPSSLPDDLEMQITLTGGTTGDCWIDSMAFGPVVYGNGCGFGILAGTQQFVRNDRFQVQITNPTEGIFQRMFRRLYRLQMPSASSPTILDSLAT